MHGLTWIFGDICDGNQLEITNSHDIYISLKDWSICIWYSKLKAGKFSAKNRGSLRRNQKKWFRDKEEDATGEVGDCNIS